jgi:hypothetical protein
MKHDMVVTDVDPRGQARSYVVLPDSEPVDITAAELPARPAATARTVATVEGSYEDRARGFSHATFNLSWVTGVLFVIAAIAIKDSITFGLVTMWFFTGFCAVWLIAFFLHTFISAEGAEFIEVVMYWRFINREQDERHRRYKAGRK